MVKNKAAEKIEKQKVKQLGLIDVGDVSNQSDERTLSSILSKRIINTSYAEQEVLRKKRAELITNCISKYTSECKNFISRGYVIEPNTVNNCYDTLIDTESFDSNCVNVDDIIVLKSIIRSFVTDTLHLMYIYSNPQYVLRSLAEDLRMKSPEYDYQLTVDIAYSEVFNEMRLQQAKRGKLWQK